MNIDTIVVIGAGTMGHGIAQVGAMGGYQVYLNDVSQEMLNAAQSSIEKNLQKGVSLGKVKPEEMEASLSRITYSADLDVIAPRADLVIEAVPEILSLKCEIFARLDGMCPPHAILATNTSTLSPSAIGAATMRPDKVIAMHYFNPVHIMKLVEVIRSLETSDETCEAALAVAHQMGKETVVVNESPGFVTSRMSALVGNEAFYMLMEGVASAEDIDKAIKLGLNYPMGPLELADLVGLDVRLKNLEYLYSTLGEKFRPCPLMVKYVKAGRLGRKTGRGVYNYIKE
ncbi:MAG: 3-hydroxyacyl-CoA dehydrogenase [Anaerolineales bacterium]|nr:3-hydroxyacyl-CoA dehydrogenase [Anaerolineales bacterium]